MTSTFEPSDLDWAIAAHPGAEFSDFASCECCDYKEV